MSFAAFLTQEQVERIHEASLEILEEVGLKVRYEPARAMFEKHGCSVDGERVKFPREVVEKYRKMCPPTFTFYARDPKFDRTIPRDSPVIVTASSAPDIIDPVTGHERRAESGDIARIAHLINELPGYDMFSISTLADDAPAGQFTISRLYPALKYCLKPIRVTTTDHKDTLSVMKMAYMVAGGEEAYKEHPFLTHHYCPTVSPLSMDHLSTENVMYFASEGLPVYPTIVPNAGLTSPMSMAGTLVQGNAEFLATTVLMQMVKEGTPTIYATLATVADMRTGAYTSGAIECGMLHMAFAQMSRFYNVPCGGYVGLTNSKLNDAQSGYETGMSAMGGLLGGMDMFNVGGLIDALKTFDFAKAVIDDEVAQMLKRAKRGVNFSEDELAIGLIKEIGPGGSFITAKHTISRMKTEAVMTKLADRDARTTWEKKGSTDIHARAMKRVKEVMTSNTTPLISPELDDKLRAEFPGMVAGMLHPIE
ncbi:MAG TPA: trimethylamine methyltransferase family protein [Anaerolineales bacterium]|nr:trimethylamine methyltransferase family protein [Anaerolineales bacterium]HMZ44461.1 trimethylamine methyltransferase family protein [Anaerolineales bacterium]HNC90531.1 trimethylamine methyltransferase family protein [Anaerolineales bacterium]HNE69588.1 trimethylamine methyltransferase family protein [Anaerolineales bacterium]HNF36197.1 trimethylamine methyltransferase family protein [Anaerolineales bacterium]